MWTLHILFVWMLMLGLSLGSWHQSQYDDPKSSSRQKKSQKPNIVLILTDDQDEMLGSMEVMPKTLRIMRDQGVHFNNSFVSTPMCCPSRSSILTGLYTHNHNVHTNNNNCSSPYWQRTHETRTFATYLNNAGYRTGYFGKYLNEYNGTYIPPGWREWVGLIKNTRFYNYTVNFNGNKMKHMDNYYQDYFTDLIANDSVTFLKNSKQYFPRRPVLMVLSVPAPHGPEDAAPQYQHLFYNNTLHRTPTWNMAPNPDKQFLLKVTGKMEPIEQKFTDILHQKRLQTLQSVDELVEKVYNELWYLNELENTYIIYTSDHGYHLGQFGVVKGKSMPYDFDTRVPLYIRGPGIKPRSKISNIVVNIDLAPTILDMAGVAVPSHMDGRSMLKLIRARSYRDQDHGRIDSNNFVTTKRPWRDTILLERGKVTIKKRKELMRQQKKNFLETVNSLPTISDSYLKYATPKQKRIFKECSKPENQPPCKKGQKYQCIQEYGREMPRLMKCRLNDKGRRNMQKDGYLSRKYCPCGRRKYKMNRREKQSQKQFLMKHVSKGFTPKFIRTKRSYLQMVGNVSSSSQNSISSLPVQPFDRRCRVLPNDTVSCDRVLYQDPVEWKTHKEKLDEMIEEYRKMLEDLRVYRKHLKASKPLDSYLNQFGKEDTGYMEYECEPCNSRRLERKKEIDQRRRRRRNRKKRRKHKPLNGEKANSPLWNSTYWNLPPDEKVSRRKHPACKRATMDCTLMDNTHWKTPPYWTNGPFCFCTNSNNNTYWCIRTINETHDLLYCEFINNFISYYDLKKDPYQMRNAIHDVNYGILQQLHEQLNAMRACEGSKECNKAGLFDWMQLLTTGTYEVLTFSVPCTFACKINFRISIQFEVSLF
ncbi:putative extracellular sulfatase Sulf-1 homolog isoform X2 [Ostrea edulis]|uniref:putative extracellular sulfatase Sulf-1 homolog isoform X2 n=1 Tax=Ostrea edulis TaxID=37623 RepID=UPI0024AEDA7A|nr:putative extracellular sulfatase Sulf-1 homolog isoform X2 [Ostrea edulis]XP_055996147.1 putative extracellular sulfatase Sulf-1 homolog isoform X2 [Ostrea edulis]